MTKLQQQERMNQQERQVITEMVGSKTVLTLFREKTKALEIQLEVVKRDSEEATKLREQLRNNLEKIKEGEGVCFARTSLTPEATTEPGRTSRRKKVRK